MRCLQSMLNSRLWKHYGNCCEQHRIYFTQQVPFVPAKSTRPGNSRHSRRITFPQLHRMQSPPPTSLPPPEIVNIWQKISPIAKPPTSKYQQLDFFRAFCTFHSPLALMCFFSQPIGASLDIATWAFPSCTFSPLLGPWFFLLQEHKL